MIKLFCGDCMELLKNIDSESVDLVLCDPPYGTTRCRWDTTLPLQPLWVELNRIIKPSAPIVLFCNEPFTSVLINSNLKGFKYRWVWDKKIPSGMNYAKYRPMQQTEDIAVFTKNGEKSIYYPQMVKRNKPIKGGGMVWSESSASMGYKALKKTYEYKNPTTLLSFDKIRKGSVHPTQKPVPLLEYLVKTYTKEGDTVLDFCMGSGSTGVACVANNRNFIGIELERKYHAIAEARIWREAGKENK